MSTRLFKVWRGDKTGGQLVDYTVDVQDGMVVLDAIHQIQREQAHDLACRWNCKAAKCGSCSAEVNGKPRLMCKTRLDDFVEGQTITVQPMKAFPLIRDLVTDVSWNYTVNKKIPPFTPKADTNWLMQQRDVDRSQEFRKCIECFLCQDVCHVLREHDLKTNFSARDSWYAWQVWKCTRWILWTAPRYSKTKAVSGCATSPNAVRKCAPKKSTLPTTRLFPLKSAWWINTTTPSVSPCGY